MNDVAALAGVSLKTVSRVVNREAGVSDDLVRRVSRAAEQLDYRPNLGASNLRRGDGKTATIGLLLENVSNPFSAAVHRAIENAARERGVAVFAASLDEDPERERAFVDAFVARRVDGLIIAPASRDQSYLLTERRAGLAIVFVDRAPVFLDADAVVASNREGARTGVDHLVRGGHRRIAYLGDLATIATARERYTGYEEALLARGFTVDPRIVVPDLHASEAAEAAALALLAGGADGAPPTAVFASQNLVTIGVIHALRKLGLEHRIAIVGFDDVPLADLLEPGLTVVAQDPTAIGAAAAELLFRRLDGDRSPSEERVIPTRLIVRGSGEIPPP